MSNLVQQNLTMSSREMASLCEKRHDSVKRTIDTLAAKRIIESPQIVNFNNINNVGGIEYLVTKRDSYVIVAQLSPEFTARLVDRWQELEEQNRLKQIPTTYIDAMKLALKFQKLYTDELENSITAEEHRQELTERLSNAIRTKAEIGSRREATAMNTASTLSKKVKALEIQLDSSLEYATVKKMQALHKRKFAWKPLKQKCDELGTAPIKVSDPNYPLGVNAYHASVWRDCYGVLLSGDKNG